MYKAFNFRSLNPLKKQKNKKKNRKSMDAVEVD